jgi:hypothetical protein
MRSINPPLICCEEKGVRSLRDVRKTAQTLITTVSSLSKRSEPLLIKRFIQLGEGLLPRYLTKLYKFRTLLYGREQELLRDNGVSVGKIAAAGTVCF